MLSCLWCLPYDPNHQPQWYVWPKTECRCDCSVGLFVVMKGVSPRRTPWLSVYRFFSICNIRLLLVRDFSLSSWWLLFDFFLILLCSYPYLMLAVKPNYLVLSIVQQLSEISFCGVLCLKLLLIRHPSFRIGYRSSSYLLVAIYSQAWGVTSGG